MPPIAQSSTFTVTTKLKPDEYQAFREAIAWEHRNMAETLRLLVLPYTEKILRQKAKAEGVEETASVSKP